MVGAVLYIVGCLASSLVSTHYMPVASPPVVTAQNNSRHCPLFTGGQNHPWWKTSAIDGEASEGLIELAVCVCDQKAYLDNWIMIQSHCLENKWE